MAALNAPLIYKTYQDVKNNLIYWTIILLIISGTIVYFLFLNDQDRTQLNDLVKTIGSNSFMGSIAGIAMFGVIATIAVILISGIQIHDKIYDKLFIRWRESYDVEFILPKLIEPIKNDLPKNFKDFARKYKYEFMKPFYEFVGDRKPGIAENTRIRFYERVTWYWATQLNEIFILIFLLWSPIFLLLNQGNNSSVLKITVFILILLVVGILNRWLVRNSRQEVIQATSDEIEEILAKPMNVKKIKSQYVKLCKTHRL